ncbi:hypothetical protein FQ142_08315 [Microbacterium sp. ANT_H45B]|uniref:hypothetical protein n=1 Tax=Microbacterium sp. ANT_H45B TaxID=2597346 RepID=UPI0011EF5663|nr:hypothetical protein [Microbacterium sp. ANT_H45B]KAA0960875.1 hypothetical protein FQ142_08315 [Microbacterium sp. ANT_H45B]
MESWVPLFVAVVAGVAAISVAFWNSRGESAELRQLRAMNEVISGLDADATEAVAFMAARDALLKRVAESVRTAPRRRGVALSLAGGVVIIAALVWGAATVVPALSTSQVEALLNVLAIVVAAGAVAMGWLVSDAFKTTHRRSRRRMRDRSQR